MRAGGHSAQNGGLPTTERTKEPNARPPESAPRLRGQCPWIPLAPMLNYIWVGMMLVAIVVGGLTGRAGDVSTSFLKSAETAVMSLALPLGGVMALMLGIMRLVEKSGLIVLLARAVRPVMSRLFPDVPPEHPAMGAMMLNLAANFLGAGNAATPLGLRAMHQLERLNPHPGTATNAMCLFLALNTGAVTLVSATALTILTNAGSKAPTAVIGTSFLAACCAAITGVLVCKACEKLPAFAPKLTASSADATTPEKKSEADYSVIEPKPLSALKKLWLWVFGIVLIASYLLLAKPDLFAAKPAEAMVGAASQLSFMQQWASPFSLVALPFFFGFVILYAALSGLTVFDEFIEGAKEGMATALRVIPFLVAMIVATGALRSSGVIGLITDGVKSGLQTVHAGPAVVDSADLLPMALMRPLSGSGSSAVLKDLVGTHGPDSMIGRTAATMYGSTETTFYVLSVYFGAVAARRTRHALVAGLAADLAGMIASIALCRWMF